MKVCPYTEINRMVTIPSNNKSCKYILQVAHSGSPKLHLINT